MPILKPEIALQAETEIAKATLVDKPETGCGLACEYIRDRSGKMVAYQVTITTDSGFRKTFAKVAASEPPDDTMIMRDYLDETLGEIKRRREDRLQSSEGPKSTEQKG